jgi:uncharacterized protein
MTDWLLILMGGLLGSSHCIGMCGGFALLLGAHRRGLAVNLGRQVVYSLGRIFTYSVAGALAGYGGWRLTRGPWSPVTGQALLALAAGILLIVEGLSAGGFLPRLRQVSRQPALCGAASLAALLNSPCLHHVFLGGLANGLLPCGLVYAYLALAAGSGHWLGGLATMACFGLGTLPMMVLIGCGGSLLSLGSRRHLFRLAAACVVAMGLLSVVRGMAFLEYSSAPDNASCPYCR